MGKPTGFLEVGRQGPRTRPVPVRLRDWREVYEPQDDAQLARQGARCMDCGIPFCTQGCPLGNPIPAFNDAVYRGRWDLAATELARTNNFPEFTGRLCPAPCESACVLGIADLPVTIERLEYEVAEHAFAAGIAGPGPNAPDSGRHVAVVGSGPAGLAAAAQLRGAGHAVEVFERSDAIGGLLRYGIPEFKMEKSVLDRRLALLTHAGVVFHAGVSVGAGGTPLADLQRNFDAVLLAIGSTTPRLIAVEGADLVGVFPAMTYLEAANRAVRDAQASLIDAHGLDVVILGGGDTGADCLGTAHRQGAASVTQIEILERPPEQRPADQPWPSMPRVLKTTSAHEEGGARVFSTETLAFRGPGYVTEIEVRDLHSGEVRVLPADLVLIAAGFTGPELERLGLNAAPFLSARNTIAVDDGWRVAGLKGSAVFACGDAVRGQSLIVWAIAEGRSAAAAIDAHLRGTDSALPAPLAPYALSW
ncbi:MAG: glutamate synthase subunit beta [Acidobacteriota bacterium]|nr:glutamate synthase subunit beta [Acidobacteriota bacterium]